MATATTPSTPSKREFSRPINWDKKPQDCSLVGGNVSKVRYRDDETGFVVVELDNGTTVIGEDAEEDIRDGRTYKFAGRWESAGRWGRRFKFDLAMLDIPKYRDGMIGFLADNTSLDYDRATSLWKSYAADAVRMLTDEHEIVARDMGYDLQFCKLVGISLKRLMADEAAKLDLFKLMSGRGFSRKLTAKLIRFWGPGAAAKVKKDPLKLHTLFGVPLKRADKLYTDLGLAPDDLKRQALWAAHGAGSVDGSTWVIRDHAEDAIYNNCGRHHEGIMPDRAIKLAVRSGIMCEKRIEKYDFVASRSRHDDEQGVVQRIMSLKAGRPLWPALPENAGLSEHQVFELGKAIAGHVGLFLGTPGTGKTFSSAAIVQELIKQHSKELVAVCAPTGKAAVRCTIAMQQAGADVQAVTIHKLLGYHPGDECFESNRYSPLRHKFILVDESSMLDCYLMSALLSACSDGSHILFIGDPYQLPPVGHGAPLRDFAAAGLPCGLLTEIRRNAGLIVAGCAAIKDGKAPKFCDRIDLETGANLRLIKAAKPRDVMDKLAEVVDRIAQKFAANPKDPATWDPIWQVQVIVAANKRSELARKPVNDMLQKLLNGGAASAGHDFHVGDKIICLRNGQYAAVEISRDNFTNASDWTPLRSQKPLPGKSIVEHYVANGEIGECLAISPSSAVFQFEGNRSVRVHVNVNAAQSKDDDEKDMDRGRGCNFDLAYAITCHKSQGSGWPVVIVLADENAGMIASREWHYTAISRAEKMCLVIGKLNTIESQIKRVALQVRTTAMVGMLKGATA